MYKQPDHPLTLIPGPIEFEDAVLEAMAHYSVAHTTQPFIGTFQSALKSLRTLFFSSDPQAQAFVIAGSGTLGWDLSTVNFLEPGDKVLLLNTGFFSSLWAEALRAYGIEVTELKAEVGDVVPLSDVEKALGETQYKAITTTHVDTSTSVVTDVRALSEVVHSKSPETLIFVDGVCSVAVEPLKFDEWKLDFVLTASQKAIGVPSGLHISMASKRALDILDSRKTPIRGHYTNLKRWLPIMRAYESGQPSYFATPAVQSIYALKTSLDLIATSSKAIEQRWKTHAEASDKVKDTLEELGIKIVAKNRQLAAHGLTAAFLPEGWNLSDLLSKLLNDGFVIAPGILQPIAPNYFRIGHMGVSVTSGHVDRLIEELRTIFKKQ